MVRRSDLFVFPKPVVAEGLWDAVGSSSVPEALTHAGVPSYGALQGQLYGGPRVLSRMNVHHEVERPMPASPGPLDYQSTRPY